MSSERDKPDNGELVAEVYKSVATERAPEHLNQRVLAMAASAHRTRYSRTRTWVRPMAWAATIGLSLAIVLETTRLPQTGPDSLGSTTAGERAGTESPAPAEAGQGAGALQPATAPPLSHDDASRENDGAVRSAASLEDEFVPQDMEILRKAQGMARTQAGPDQPPADARADAVTSHQENAAPVTGTALTEPSETAPAGADVSGGSRAATAADLAVTAPEEQRSSPKRRAARAAATASEAETGLAATSMSAVAASESLAAGRPCPDEARESAESWLACIDELRAHGEKDLADAELGDFRRKYPDLADDAAD